MKSNTFNYSLLAVGVAALMGVSTGANAATSGNAGTNSKTIKNVATASYSIDGTTQTAESNSVTVSINEVISFELTADNTTDGDASDDINNDEEVAPEGFAKFVHTIKNTGNVADSYTYEVTTSDYDVANSTADYTLYDADGTELATDSTAVASGSFDLKAGQYIKVTINAKTTGNQGGNEQNLNFAVTSTKITAAPNGATPTLNNTDNSITKLPVFSIAKTITSNTFNINDPSATVDYQVVVKNVAGGYSTDATDVAIEDFLPTGLIMNSALTSADITVAGGATLGSTISNTANGFSFNAPKIPEGATITINFKAKKDPDAALAQDALNHVTVTDDLDDDASTDNTLVDSTDSLREDNINFYPADDDINITDGSAIADGTDGTDSTQPLNSVQRDVTLTNAETIIIPPNTIANPNIQATHTAIITNNGRDVEGDDAGELTFAIEDLGNSANIGPIAGSAVIIYNGTRYPIRAVNGVYDINSVIPAGIANGETATIEYKVISDGAELDDFENTTVTLTTTGDGAPATPPAVTDTTEVQGIKLEKTQALDAACDGVADGTLTDANITADAGQCVIYNIKATNTFPVSSNYPISNLVISDATDNFSAGADYRTGSATNNNTSGTISQPSVADPNVKNDVSTLAPQASAQLQFGIKIKQD